MSAQRARYLVVGLPEAGKSSFIAALWHAATNGDIDGGLRLEAPQGSVEYLNRICAAWQSCQPVQRTLTGDVERVAMTLVDDVGRHFELTMPDASGERYRQHWATRRCEQQYAADALAASGLMLFAHSGVRAPTSIREAEELAAELSPEAEPDEKTGNTVPWEPENAPTQVQLVEALQFVEFLRPEVVPIRVAVVVSAWDLVSAEGLSPRGWVKTRLPLLGQFLHANTHQFTAEYFGVSAQGGAYETERDRLLDIDEPSTRIEVVTDEGGSHDITLPLKWLLDYSCGL